MKKLLMDFFLLTLYVPFWKIIKHTAKSKSRFNLYKGVSTFEEYVERCYKLNRHPTFMAFYGFMALLHIFLFVLIINGPMWIFPWWINMTLFVLFLVMGFIYLSLIFEKQIVDYVSNSKRTIP